MDGRATHRLLDELLERVTVREQDAQRLRLLLPLPLARSLIARQGVELLLIELDLGLDDFFAIRLIETE